MQNSENAEGVRHEPLPPGKRRRLQQLFEHASRKAAQNDHDYATELFTECVVEDPGNSIYLQSFLGNLKKKYDNNKKGVRLALIRAGKDRAAVKKNKLQKNWPAVLKHGIEVLRLNPWDVPTLLTMSAATDEMGLDEIPLIYLKTALDANHKDPEVNRVCGRALRARRQYDQAIACWHRVEEAKPGDEQAQREIAELAVEKTIYHGGYEEAESSHDVAKKKQALDEKQQQHEPTPEEKLQRQIARDPEDLNLYLELAEIHFRGDDYEKAEDVLRRAYEASDDDPDIRERWEDAQLRNLRQKIREAETETQNSGTEESAQREAELRKQFNLKSLQVYENRCQRYPNNLIFKFRLGEFHQIAGQHNEAIQQYQQARNDPRRKGLCMLKLGQCFQQIKQYRLAMTHFASAIDEIPDRDANNKKEALYNAGRLAIGLKDFDLAEKHLTALAGLDFGYKDVSALLDKIADLREND